MTRQPAPEWRPVGLTIAGSDSGGGAGIQADLKTMEANGVFATSAVTSVTAQNSVGVESTHVLPVEEVTAQIDAVVSDFDVRAAKTGMLATAPIVEAVTDAVRDLDAPVVVDPVMVAASGDRLLEPAGEEAYEDLIAEATLVTPNADEAEVLAGIEITGAESATEAGHRLVEMGADAALVKGGHVPGETVRDAFVVGDDARVFEHPRIETDATHGSGCAASSVIVAWLAHGDPLQFAVAAGLEFMQRAIRYPIDAGEGPGSVHHLVELRERAAHSEIAEAVDGIVQWIEDIDASPLVPEVGMNVVGATPYSETVGEVAAVEGRITRTLSGARPNRGVRFGASSHVGRFLLSARERDPELRFAANCRFDDDVEAALETLEIDAVEVSRDAEPAPDEEGRTMSWAARQGFEVADGTPDAIFDRGALGKEPMLRLLSVKSETLEQTVADLVDEVR